MEKKSKELSSPHLKSLKKDLNEVLKAGSYLEEEKKKLAIQREKIRKKIRKEKEILRLKSRIQRLKNKKK